MNKNFLSILAAWVILTIAGPQARAVYTGTVAEVGPNVVLTGSGSIDVAGLVELSTTGGSGLLYPSLADVGIGITTAPAVLYQGKIAGPTNFGAGMGRTANSSARDYAILYGQVANKPLIAVPGNYVSGAPLSGTALFTNASFASPDFTPGTYTYSLATGANAESFVVTVVVPEPSTWALLGIGFTVSRRRRAAA